MAIPSSRRERTFWLAAAGLLLLIYSTLYIARPVAEWLRDHNLLRLAVGLVAVAVVAAAAVGWRRVRPGRREIVVLALATLLYASLIPILHSPEEAMHLIEYGGFGLLVLAAMRERQRSRTEASWWLPPVAAVLLTAAAGWLDEGIQLLLPNRYYDLRDVAFNVSAAVLSVGAAEGCAWARRRDRSGA